MEFPSCFCLEMLVITVKSEALDPSRNGIFPKVTNLIPLISMLVHASDIVDTAYELCAFDPRNLEEQALFVQKAIHHILERTKQSSIILIGHSMGGIVARQVLASPNFDASVVLAIFTLATPHLEPPAPISYAMHAFYNRLNSFWKIEHGHGGLLENVTVVSIAGGNRDLMVNSGLTHVDSFLNPNLSFTAYSTGMPRTWSSAQHEGMVWCEQILYQLSKGIYGIITPALRRPADRNAVLRNIFLPIEFTPPVLDTLNGLPTNHYKIQVTNIISAILNGNIQIPSIKTPAAHSEMIYIGLRTESNTGTIKLLTDLKKGTFKVHACYDLRSVGEMRCTSLNEYIDQLPMPQYESHTMRFRGHYSPVSEDLPFWSKLEINKTSLPHASSIVFEVAPGNEGFLYGGVYLRPTEVNIDSTNLAFLFGVEKTLKPTIKTTLNFPHMTDETIKYRIQVGHMTGALILT
jgi:hypothetical protein